MRRWTWRRYYGVQMSAITAIAVLAFCSMYALRQWFHMPDKISYWLSCLAGMFVAKTVVNNVPEPSNGYIRGAKGEAREGVDPKPSSDPWAVNFLGGWIPFQSASQSFLILGAPKSGKTIVMRLMMQSVLPFMGQGKTLGRMTKCVFHSTKAELYKLVRAGGSKTRIVDLNPFDRRCRPWHMAADIKTKADAQMIAAGIVPQRKGNASTDNSSFFEGNGRILVAHIMTNFLRHAKKTDAGIPDWTFRDVVLTLRNKDRIRVVLSKSHDSKHFITNHLESPKAFANVQNTIDVFLEYLEPIAALWDAALQNGNEPVSLDHWVESDEEYSLLLAVNNRYEEHSACINRIILNRLFTLCLSRDDANGPTHWFWLDEATALQRIPKIDKALREGRSKGISVVLGIQDPVETEDDYGERKASAILGLCGNQCHLGFMNPKAAAFCSSVFGNVELLEPQDQESEGMSGQNPQHGTSRSWSRKKKELVEASEFQYQPESGPEHGVRGFTKSFDVARKRHVSGEDIFGKRDGGRILKEGMLNERPEPVPSDEVEKDFWADDNQELREWTVQDLDRLNLLVPEMIETLSDEEQSNAKYFEKHLNMTINTFKFISSEEAATSTLQEKVEKLRKWQAEDRPDQYGRAVAFTRYIDGVGIPDNEIN